MKQRIGLLLRSGHTPAARAPGARIKTPTVLQMEAVECGAAALGIILAYHGKIVPLEELRVACGVSRDGSKASNILRAASSYGLIAKGYGKEPHQLPALPLPAIVFWNFKHYVVVEGFGKGRVYINDPATGPRTIPDDEFDQSFTGVVLTFVRGPDFKPSRRRRTLLHTLRPRLRGASSGLLYILLASLLLVVLGLVVPAFTRIFVDYYLGAGLGEVIALILPGMALTALLIVALTWLQQQQLLRLETSLALTSSSSFFWHVLRLPIEFFTQRYAGDISSRVAINNRVASLLSGDVATTLLSVVLAAFYVVLMARYDLLLTAVGVAIAIANLAVLRLIARQRIDQNRRMLQERAKLVSTAYHGLQLIETLKATGGESDFFARWAGYQAKMVNAEQGLGVSTRVIGVVPSLLTAIGMVAILTLGGLRIMQGQLTAGTLVAFQVLMLAFMGPINQLVVVGRKLQMAEADLSRLDDVLRYPAAVPSDPAPADEEPIPARAKLAGRVELKDVTFGYSRLEPPLIEGFSLTLRPGARVALVGASGSGKSTIARLIAGLYAPWSGEILFDGRPRTALPRTLLQNSLAVVDQDTFLFAGTIKDNLTLWDTTVAEISVHRAAMDAAIHDEISDRPGGYDYAVEEGGRDLSGGQSQRLELARALAQNPTVLVLDEATSALDPVTEQQIDDSLRRRGCTCLIVAHRLSTIRDCDEIVVLERGKVVQRGTHEQMARVPGPYRQLLEAGEPDGMAATGVGGDGDYAG